MGNVTTVNNDSSDVFWSLWSKNRSPREDSLMSEYVDLEGEPWVGIQENLLFSLLNLTF